MRKKSTSARFHEDTPITQSDINSGNLVLRKRDTNGLILSNGDAQNFVETFF